MRWNKRTIGEKRKGAETNREKGKPKTGRQTEGGREGEGCRNEQIGQTNRQTEGGRRGYKKRGAEVSKNVWEKKKVVTEREREGERD